MIDIIKAKKFYEEYINRYDIENKEIKLKKDHIYRTAEKSKWIATKLNLSEEDVMLAELIGLLHDIGRFEQVKVYNTFVDTDSIDHGKYGVEILYQNNFIRNFIEDNQYDEIIKNAVLFHNKNDIDVNMPERIVLHCKIVRDADKLDILNILTSDSLKPGYSFDKYPKEHISKEIMEDFIIDHKIKYIHRKTSADMVASYIAYVFDINYIYTLIEINNNDYINKLLEQYGAKEKDTIEDLERLRKIANKYMQEKLEEENICLKNY